jgi:hypothetical protein
MKEEVDSVVVLGGRNGVERVWDTEQGGKVGSDELTQMECFEVRVVERAGVLVLLVAAWNECG